MVWTLHYGDEDKGFSVPEKSLSTFQRESKETRGDVRSRLRGVWHEGPSYD